MSANDNDDPTPRTPTGRIGNPQPRPQNIPIRTEEGRRVSAAFRAGLPPLVIDADYAALERRLMASSDLSSLLHEAKVRKHRHRWRRERENWTVEDCLWRDGEE